MHKYILHKISQYFPKPFERFGGNIKVELDLSNCVMKADLKETTGSVAESNLASNLGLASFKA